MTVDSRTSGGAQLSERLELLRLRGAGHRLELALARQDLREQTQGLRRGAGIALAIMQLLVPRNARSRPSFVDTLLRYAAWIVPAASTLIFRSKSQRPTGRWRSALVAGSLGMMLLRLWRG